MAQQLSAAGEGAAAGAAGAHEPFQRLALFSYDGTSGVARESLQTALEMLAGVVQPLGGTAEEASSLPADALRQMLEARRSELEARLEEVARRDDAGDADTGGVRRAVKVLLCAEREVLKRAL